MKSEENKTSIAKNETVPIHFIGFGINGANILKYYQSKGIQGKYSYVSNNLRDDLGDASFIKLIPPEGNYLEARKRVSIIEIDIPQSLINIIQSNQRLVLLTGLGCFTGTVFSEGLTKLLYEENKNFLTISLKPFRFEGERALYAQEIINRLRSIPNFKFFELDQIERDTPIRQGLHEVFDLIYDTHIKGNISES